MTNEAVIHTQALAKSYGDAEAVRRLNLSVGRNRITAFLGRNGAGKSTTIKMLLGMIRLTAGSGTVLGKQIANTGENREMRQRVAYVAEDKPLYGYMTVEQTIRFSSYLKFFGASYFNPNRFRYSAIGSNPTLARLASICSSSSTGHSSNFPVASSLRSCVP
jgi:ABC-type multidrug transport system ATPase subunit